MFLFGEKIENRTFLPFLTPQKRNLVGPSETIWPLFRIWGSTWLEPQIRKSNGHCILVLSRQNLKSGIPKNRPKTSFQLSAMGNAIYTPLYEVATANYMIDTNTQWANKDHLVGQLINLD